MYVVCSHIKPCCLLCHVLQACAIPHLTTLHMYIPHFARHSKPLHCTLPLPLQSQKRLREREDTSSPWHTCPTPLHLVEGMPLCPSSDHMGWNLSSSISPSCLVWNSVELQFHKLYAIWYIKEMFWLCTHDVIIITFHTCMPIHHIISYYENLTVKNV